MLVPNLKLRLSFQNNVTDLSANGNVLTKTGSGTYGAGIRGLCYYGSSAAGSYVSLSGSTCAFRAATTITVCCWAKKNTNDLKFIGYWGGAASSQKIIFRQVAANLQAYIYTTSGQIGGNIGTFPTDGLWHHYALVYDKVNLRVYVDGVLFGAQYTSIANLVVPDTGVNCVIGSEYDYSSPSDGYLDEINIFDRALTVAEIKRNMAGFRTGLLTSPLNMSEQFAVFAAPLDGGAPINPVLSAGTVLAPTYITACHTDAARLGQSASGGILLPLDSSAPIKADLSVTLTMYVIGVSSVSHDYLEPKTAGYGQPLSFPSLAVCTFLLNITPPALAALSIPGTIQPNYSTAIMATASSHAVPRQAIFISPLELSGQLEFTQAQTLFFGIPALVTATAPLTIEALNIILSTLAGPLNLGPESVIMPAPVYTVFANSVNTTDLISGLEITEDIEAAHSSFRFTSIAKELFDSLNPADALTITINGVTREFIIDEMGMPGDLTFNPWGRSASCLLDTPYHPAVTVETAGTQTAAGLALSLAGCTVWNAHDYPLPEGWSMTGTPVEIVIRLAATVGAVVQPDGSGIKVIPRYPVRPIDWSSSVPAALYQRETNILSLSWNDEGKTPWNSLIVTGRTTPWSAPILELEEESPAPGDVVHVRVYRKGTSEALFESMVTAGIVVLVGMNMPLTVEDEPAQFSGYRAGVKYPLDNLRSFSWVGNSRGDIYWLADGRSTELELAPGSYPDLEGCGLAKITYQTSYDRYQLRGHNVPQLMLICSQPDNETVRVKLLVEGEREPSAPQLTEELATTQGAAVAAGTAWLDGNRYNERKISASAPHEAAALPGAVVCLADEIEGVSGAGMVQSRTIRISGPSVIDALEVVQCLF